ncbi:MAG: radical SAM protein [Coriobacteriales bacterium]
MVRKKVVAVGIKESLAGFGLKQALGYLSKDPDTNIPKVMALVDKYTPDGLFEEQRYAFRKAIEEKNNWYQLIRYGVTELDPGVRDRFFESFLVNANLSGWPEQERNREKYGCNIPWAILLDPTSACNLHCKGCWAAEYGNRLNLSYDDIDSIIKQGEALGCYFYIYTGGEPLVRKHDVIALCEAHPECSFMSFTNGTLIDEKFCQDMLRVKNFIPVLSIEGDETSTDSRRGEGTYGKVTHAMKLLKDHRLIFGLSACVTSVNEPVICTEEYFQQMIDWGAIFTWFFTFMPVGVDAVPELIPTAEQRNHMTRFIREMRGKMPLFTMDFWGDSQYVGGCIAGGRRYLHINAAGDVDPCVFAHYSNANIHDVSLLEALQSPLFMAYHDNQPFNDNLMRPCPILDNPGKLAEMVDATGAHSTDLQAPEDAHDLCAKCVPSALEWKPVSEKLWSDFRHERAEGMAKRAEEIAQQKSARKSA